MTYPETAIIMAALAALLSIVWHSLKTGISPMPSSGKAVKVILEEVKRSGRGPVTDTGSGWGTLAVAIAKEHPERKVTGYELSPIPWIISVIRKKIKRLDNLTMYRKNFLKADLSDTSVIVCYLYPEGMKKLEHKLRSGKPAGYTLISSTFALPSRKPERVIKLNDMHRTPVYIYRF